jgi:hypothetical protein
MAKRCYLSTGRIWISDEDPTTNEEGVEAWNFFYSEESGKLFICLSDVPEEYNFSEIPLTPFSPGPPPVPPVVKGEEKPGFFKRLFGI